MLSHRDRVERAGATVVAVVADDAAPVRERMLRDLEMPWPVVSDPDHGLYRAWGLLRGSLWEIYSPRALWGYARAAMRGERIDPPGRDTLQLGGDFVVAPDGTLAYSHPQRGPSDRPPAGKLVGCLEALAG